LTERGL